MTQVSTARAPVAAARIELFAPVASFRDPMFPCVSRCLPVPPPSTVRGMLAAATGAGAEPVVLGLAAHHDGRGVDDETYHPIAADGSNPAVAGQVAAGKGGRTLRQRPFLVGVHLTVWVPEPDAERIAAALRRPVWGLRLGRSQDLVHIRSICRVRLQPTREAVIGHALAPPGSHDAPAATVLRLAHTVSTDRWTTEYGSFLWCARPAGRAPVRGAYRDPTDDQAVWLHTPAPDAAEHAELAQVWAKSPERSPLGRPELLTEHSQQVRTTARTLARRIGSPGLLAEIAGFWSWVETAALLHDAGKVAEGFQRQLRPGGPAWGERHEVLSLAYVDLLTRTRSAHDRRMIAAAVVSHHRCLIGANQLAEHYAPVADWKKKFGIDPSPEPGRPRTQVPPARHRAALSWFAGHLHTRAPADERRKLWELARDAFARSHADWCAPVPGQEGLVAVLLQGALTLADHAASAHVDLQTHMPLPADFLTTLASPYPHQKDAAASDGHLVLRAPTGSGKTEAGLAWASRQIAAMPAQPRLVWVLPYRASIDAARDRFRHTLIPAPGDDKPDIAILHSGAAQTLLTCAVADDTAAQATAAADTAAAHKARDQADVMRGLFAQRVRIATPHQLLRAAIAGPRYASVLLEQANTVIVLDELHAYDPTTFGRICAAMRLWEQLGSRVAVLSATLAPPMLALVEETLTQPVTHLQAPQGTAPDRHRLALDEHPITHPHSLERIRAWLAQGHSVLVVANTVATAQHLYAELAPTARTAWPDDANAAILLHSRFRVCDRAAIEARITHDYPERDGEESQRRGGLVVSTQCLEVSLCLDFDRGASEAAPVEALAQRAGRVNRRGRHPQGPVEFRVHAVEEAAPYESAALAAAWHALTTTPGPLVSEQTIEEWLRQAYDTGWGRTWLEQARRARDAFTTAFLTFPDPFHDRSGHADRLDEQFDTVDVLLERNHSEFLDLRGQSALLAARLLIPITYGQFAKHRRTRRIWWDRQTTTWITDLPYTAERGLDLTAASQPDRPETSVL
ncbi:hypothetical protein GCM10027570_44610 [Streptomonospora sediminis]